VSASDPGIAFEERFVEADGFSIRYLVAGEGPTLCCFHGAGGLRLSRAHELLAESHRVVAFEAPGFGASAPNERSGSMRELAATMGKALGALGIELTSLWGTSFGGKLALWLAIDAPAGLIDSLVLESPAAIREDTSSLPPASEIPDLLSLHPERQAPPPPLAPEDAAKQQALAGRLIGPPRDPDLEAAMAILEVPTLVLFGSGDRLTPPELGRHYRRIMPHCHLVIVYDAAHAIDGDRPEAFSAIVGDFTRRKDQFVVRQESGLRYP